MKNYYLFVVFGFTMEMNHLNRIPFLYVWLTMERNLLNYEKYCEKCDHQL